MIWFGETFAYLPATVFVNPAIATEAIAFKALRLFLLSFLPQGTEVVRGQQNRVPEPATENFVAMVPLFHRRLGTNEDTFDASASTAILNYSLELTVQLDVHGPSSGDNAANISAALRDDIAVQAFAAIHPDVAPLYADEAQQAAFVNAEQQFEDRWIVKAVLQVNSSLSFQQQFADRLKVTTVPADAMYPA